MAASLPTLLALMHEKIAKIGRHQEELKARIATLTEENEELRAELERVSRERDKACEDAEFLTYSYRIANSPDSLIQTRRHIAGLIREIDRCLEMLKE